MEQPAECCAASHRTSAAGFGGTPPLNCSRFSQQLFFLCLKVLFLKLYQQFSQWLPSTEAGFLGHEVHTAITRELQKKPNVFSEAVVPREPSVVLQI